MWIVKNESAEPLPLPEFGVELAGKEYLDLDAHGREKAESAESVRSALARGVLRLISQSAAEAPAPKPPLASPPGVLRDLVEHPPMPKGSAPAFLPPPPAAPEGVREAFRRFSQRRSRREQDEAPPASPEVAALRQELERFRQELLQDIQRILENHLRP